MDQDRRAFLKGSTAAAAAVLTGAALPAPAAADTKFWSMRCLLRVG
ncbi:MAG TPA: twin-arginine translocation signal domain-containing protein [Acidobacteriaceae bacterium]|nr:twin-arginine translocation signal domain-containing protein [Acidobacteriaceae bacterium]